MTFIGVIRLMRLENERLMKLGHRHMNEAEMRFILGGIGGSHYLTAFDEVKKQIQGDPHA